VVEPVAELVLVLIPATIPPVVVPTVIPVVVPVVVPVAAVVVASILNDSRVVMMETASCWAAVRSSVATLIFDRTVISGSCPVFVVFNEVTLVTVPVVVLVVVPRVELASDRISETSSLALATLVLASAIFVLRSVKEALMPEMSKPAVLASETRTWSFGLMAWKMVMRFEMLLTAERAIWVGVLEAVAAVVVAMVVEALVVAVEVAVVLAVLLAVVELDVVILADGSVVVAVRVMVVEAVVVAKVVEARVDRVVTEVLEPDADVFNEAFKEALAAARASIGSRAKLSAATWAAKSGATV
jgi:hypothetical protein